MLWDVSKFLNKSVSKVGDCKYFEREGGFFWKGERIFNKYI